MWGGGGGGSEHAIFPFCSPPPPLPVINDQSLMDMVPSVVHVSVGVWVGVYPIECISLSLIFPGTDPGCFKRVTRKR